MMIADDEEQSGEEWCEENGVQEGVTPTMTEAERVAWWASMPPEVAAEVRAELDAVEDEYRQGLQALFERREKENQQSGQKADGDVPPDAPAEQWTDEDIDASTADLNADDVKLALGLRTSGMRELLKTHEDTGD